MDRYKKKNILVREKHAIIKDAKKLLQSGRYSKNQIKLHDFINKHEEKHPNKKKAPIKKDRNRYYKLIWRIKFLEIFIVIHL